jgi:hypothetical protein
MAIETVCMSTTIDTQKTRLGEIGIKNYIMNHEDLEVFLEVEFMGGNRQRAIETLLLSLALCI